MPILAHPLFYKMSLGRSDYRMWWYVKILVIISYLHDGGQKYWFALGVVVMVVIYNVTDILQITRMIYLDEIFINKTNDRQ